MRPPSWKVESTHVQEIAPGQWRVSDAREREADGMSVFGFVEQTELGYEATCINDPSVRRAFASLDNAIDFLADDHRTSIAELTREATDRLGADDARLSAETSVGQ